MDLAHAYRVLGVQPGAGETMVRGAYEHMQRQTPPERHGELWAAVEVIRNAGYPSAVGTPLPLPPQPPYAQPPHAQTPYAQPPYAQPPYAQPPYAQPPYAQPPYAQPPYAPPPYAQPPQPYNAQPPAPQMPAGWAPPAAAMSSPGEDFAAVERAAKHKRAMRNIGVGVLLLVIGIVITSTTHDRAVQSGGGTYVVAYGPIIIGGIRFLQGLFGLIST